jgi:hypothetical protein
MTKPLTKAQRDKQRRQSRGPEEIIRVQELQSAAYRLRASQQFQDISINHQQPPPNNLTSASSSSSSSSSSSVLHTNEEV